MDHYSKEELIVDLFLMGMDSRELNVQVAAHGHRRVDDFMRVARSHEAVHEEEKKYSRRQKPTPQARFVTNERTVSPDTDRLAKEVLALSSDSDGLSDINGEAVSHQGCWLIPVTVEGLKTLALIDTGASVSMMDRPLY